MSEVLGIVAEYNPFHNGHLYHLQKTKELNRGKIYSMCNEWKFCSKRKHINSK